MSYTAPAPVASGSTFAQLQTQGLIGHLEALLTAQVATSNPTAAGTIATGTTYGGLLPAGTYLLNFTEVSFGETAPSTESASFTLTKQTNPATQATVSVGSATTGTLPAGVYYAAYTFVDAVTGLESTIGTTESATFTVTAGTTPTITIAALPAWASSANIYLTAAGGASGTERLYATGVTGTTYIMTTGLWTNNTTTFAAAQVVPALNQTSTNKPVVTFPALQSGNVARNLYLTAPGGATGTETLYASGIGSTTFAMISPLVIGGPPLPTANNTALINNNKMVGFVRSAEKNNLDMVIKRARSVVYEYLHGAPVGQSDAIQRFYEAHVAIAMLNVAFTEVGVLLDNNPGHLTYIQSGIGASDKKRVWP